MELYKRIYLPLLVCAVLTLTFDLGSGAVRSTAMNQKRFKAPCKKKADDWLNPFLPDFIIPRQYSLWLNPDFYYSGNTYAGSVSIELEIQQETDTLIVHYKQMTISRSGLMSLEGDVIPLATAFAYDQHEYWVVQTQAMIPAGSVVVLTLDFSSSLTNGIVGFYKSTYRHDVTGIESWLATTKFQPSDARKAFPCLDEPRFRSHFTISLRHWSNFTALSNMPAERTVVIDSTFSETTFKTSPTMSTYLVCFIVCDLAHKENTFGGGLTHMIFARPDRIDQVDLALQVTPVIQDYFTNLFNVSFPLPKLYQAGIPDYPSGATEHWGMITYRDTRLLYDPAQVSDFSRQSILSIVSHELAHNHAGNLVTCHYWDELWLNEGFATYYSFKGITAADPTLYAEGQFFTRTVQSVMGTDSLNTSRPVVVPINSPDEANAAFDGIAYDKGAALLSMMEGFLGSPLYNQAISRFISNNAFETVVTADLWSSMQEAIGSSLNISAVMSPWVYSMGYPVVKIHRSTGNRFEAIQRRFLLNPTSDPAQPPTPYEYKWYIPLNYKTQTGATGIVWMNMTENVIFDIPGVIEQEWVKFNYDHTGFFRVDYDASQWNLVDQQLLRNHKAFTDRERANYLSDVMALARAAHLGYSVALDMTLYLDREEDFLPWDSIVNPIFHISNMLYTTDEVYALWKRYIHNLAGGLMDKLQIVDTGNYVQKLTRTDLTRITCDNGYVPCLTNVSQLFQPWIQDAVANPVPNNLKREVYSFGMLSSGDEVAFNTVWDRYVTATSGQEQDNLLYSLSRIQDLTLIDRDDFRHVPAAQNGKSENLLTRNSAKKETYSVVNSFYKKKTTRNKNLCRLLEYSMDESKIRSQDFFTCISYISSNRGANAHLFAWVQANYQAIVNRFGLGNRSLGRMVPGIVDSYNTPQQLQEVEDFFAQYPDAGTGQRFREEAIQNIRANILWVDTNMDTIRNWLNDNVPAAP